MDAKERAGVDHQKLVLKIESKAHKTKSSDHELGLGRIAKTKNPASPPIRSDGIQVALDIKGDPLWTSEAREKPIYFAARRDAINRIEARRCRASDVQIIVETKRQMVGRDTRLQRRKDKDFFAWADFENAPAAVPNVEISIVVECDTGRDAHSLGEEFSAPGPIHAVDVSVVPARNE